MRLVRKQLFQYETRKAQTSISLFTFFKTQQNLALIIVETSFIFLIFMEGAENVINLLLI